MKILLWHVDSDWTTAFVHGGHHYVVPVTPDRGPDGRGRACVTEWPNTVTECAVEQLSNEEFDVVILQRPHEIDLVHGWTGQRPGRDLPAIYVEHAPPVHHPSNSRHILADRQDIPVVHVTHFNQLYWDSGIAPTVVIEQGVFDPGPLYSGELPRAATHTPHGRSRMSGTDLLGVFAMETPIDVFDTSTIDENERPAKDLSSRIVRLLPSLPEQLHAQMARRRVYLHLARWESLPRGLVEAMYLAMPIVAVAATEIAYRLPRDAGVVSADIDELASGLRRLVHEPELARLTGQVARNYAVSRYGLDRYHSEWDRLLKEVAD